MSCYEVDGLLKFKVRARRHMKVKECGVNRKTRCKSGRSYNRSGTSSNAKERKLQVKIVQKEIGAKSQEISDGGKPLIFRRHDLPIHHFVAY